MNPLPLIVRLRNWVGDVVLGVPALRLLEAHGYELQLVGKGWARVLLAGEGWETVARPGSLRARVRQLRSLRVAAAARESGFDDRENALVLPASFSAALEVRLAGLRAVGYASEARGFLLARSEAPVAGAHALDEYWRLACRFLGIEREPPASVDLRVSDDAQRRADELLARHSVGERFVVICPFAGGTFDKLDKTWPRFPEFTKALLALGHEVVVCPGPGEEPIVAAGHAGAKMLAGVDLGAYGGVLRRARLMVSNDTGPGHLAAAVGAPLVSVLGPTLPQRWAPRGAGVQIVRRWPGWPTVDEVLERVAARTG
ncbi:MAG: hypothetical protein KJZ83_05195 [Burkholderiaceae bacterium]|nr:hypothetical protein [Burkholderiaceae bacterium]